ncbi:hypothetical protein E2C06_21350 [Dankookia rubra]|uniref:DUF4126 domain-containing protein n=1 Tax=Dankookia rubra TaxID=1442381 RepID=A0A4R5QCU5_9PROT|nr:hypothetical protein E2C06_21350 [Dankookia rubra]
MVAGGFFAHLLLWKLVSEAALTWVASLGKTRTGWISAGTRSRGLATAAVLAEMVGDKMPFAPDRRIAPSVLVRIATGAVGGAALTGRNAPLAAGALAGIAGATLGTLVGRTARGGTTRSDADWARALTEDAVAAGLAAALVGSAARRSRAQPVQPRRAVGGLRLGRRARGCS